MTIKDFQSLVGSLLWSSRCTRPDKSFSVHRGSRRPHQPTMVDYQLAKKIARHLSGTKTSCLSMTEQTSGSDVLRVV